MYVYVFRCAHPVYLSGSIGCLLYTVTGDLNSCQVNDNDNVTLSLLPLVWKGFARFSAPISHFSLVSSYGHFFLQLLFGFFLFKGPLVCLLVILLLVSLLGFLFLLLRY